MVDKHIFNGIYTFFNMESDIVPVLGFIKASRYRFDILNALYTNPHTPSELANITKINKGHVSRTLKELTDHKLAKCGNQEAKKGRIYLITPLGQRVTDLL